MSTMPKDCPFCGSDQVEICRTNPNACWVRCAKCGADAESHRTRSGALANWNRRGSLGFTATIVDDQDKEWTPAQKRAAR